MTGGHWSRNLTQVEELTGGKVKKAIVDRGYKVKGGLPGVDIVMPKSTQERKLLSEENERRTMQVKSRNRGTDITPET